MRVPIYVSFYAISPRYGTYISCSFRGDFDTLLDPRSMWGIIFIILIITYQNIWHLPLVSLPHCLYMNHSPCSHSFNPKQQPQGGLFQSFSFIASLYPSLLLRNCKNYGNVHHGHATHGILPSLSVGNSISAPSPSFLKGLPFLVE